MPYSDNHYLNPSSKQCESIEEVLEIIETCFPGVEPYLSKKSYTPFVLDLLSYVGYCVSLNELSYFFGPVFLSQAIKNRCSQRAKGGALKLLKVSHADMGAYKAFRLNPASYQYLAGCLPDNLKPLRGGFKIRRSGEVVPDHDYGVGLSLLSIMQMQHPFYFEKEETHAVTGALKGRGSVCIDATVYFKTDRGYRFYLEQDMGTESATTLIAKIATYKYMGLTDSNSCILFASHQCLNAGDCNSFSVPALEGVLQKATREGAMELYHFLTSSYMMLSEKELTALKALLVRVGACEAYADEAARKRNSCLKPELVCASSVMVRKRYTDNLYGLEVTGSAHYMDFTVQDLSEYLSGLKNGQNHYRLSAYGKAQEHISKLKFKNMCLVLADMLQKGNLGDEVLSLLMGYPCYVIPSCLLAAKETYIYPDARDYLQAVTAFLGTYYPGIEKAQKKEIGSPISPDNGNPFRMRNEHVLTDGSRLYIEHIGKDVGGFLRAMYFATFLDSLENVPIHLVCICDSVQDMKLFYKLTGYCVKYNRFPQNMDSCYLSFLMEEELEKENGALMSISEATKEPSYLLTDTQKALFQQFVRNGRNFPRIDYNVLLRR